MHTESGFGALFFSLCCRNVIYCIVGSVVTPNTPRVGDKILLLMVRFLFVLCGRQQGVYTEDVLSEI